MVQTEQRAFTTEKHVIFLEDRVYRLGFDLEYANLRIERLEAALVEERAHFLWTINTIPDARARKDFVPRARKQLEQEGILSTAVKTTVNSGENQS